MSRPHPDRRVRSCGAAVFATGAMALSSHLSAHAGSINVDYDEPSLDRWMYPFNPAPGSRAECSVFGTTGDDRFDDRDAQMIIGYETAGDVTPGFGASTYGVTSARVTIEVSQDLLFIYDDTHDSYRSFLEKEDPEYVPDSDAGQPIGLFGVGFRFGLSRDTFEENTPYTFGDPIGQRIRTAYAADVDGAGTPFDMSLNVTDRFDAPPWAVGTIAGLTPGDLVPIGSEMVFEIDLSNPGAVRYLQDSLDAGRVLLAVNSLTLVAQQGSEFPAFYTRENPLVALGLVSAARFELVVELLCPADVDGGGSVDFADVLAVLAGWGPCGEECPADIDGDGNVGFSDVLEILQAWGDCPS